MFLMSYGYNPTSPLPADPRPAGDAGSVEPVAPAQGAGSATEAAIVPLSFGPAIARQRRAANGGRVRDFLPTVRRRAQDTNRRFQAKQIPYRFEVYLVNNEKVMLDVSVLDGTGRALSRTSRDVTHEDFGRLMDDVSTGTGLVIDSLPPARTE